MNIDQMMSVLNAPVRREVKPWWVTTRYACPECYAPIPRIKRGQDARCQRCRRSQIVLPVNYQR